MNITKKTDYALRVISHLALAATGQKISANTIAQEETIPKPFLLKILRELRKNGFIKSFMGVNGGYTLNKDPSEISFRQIIETIDGPINLNPCLNDKEECNRNATDCVIQEALRGVQVELVNNLDAINFQNLFE